MSNCKNYDYEKYNKTLDGNTGYGVVHELLR